MPAATTTSLLDQLINSVEDAWTRVEQRHQRADTWRCRACGDRWPCRTWRAATSGRL